MPKKYTNCMILGLQVGHDITPGMAGVIDKSPTERVIELPVIKKGKLFWYQTGKLFTSSMLRKSITSIWFTSFLALTIVASAKQTDALWLTWFTLFTIGFCTFILGLVRGDVLTSRYLSSRSVNRNWFTPDEHMLIRKRALRPEVYSIQLPSGMSLGVSLWRAMGGVYTRKQLHLDYSPDEIRGLILNYLSVNSNSLECLALTEKTLTALGTAGVNNENPNVLLEQIVQELRKTRKITTCSEENQISQNTRQINAD